MADQRVSHLKLISNEPRVAAAVPTQNEVMVLKTLGTVGIILSAIGFTKDVPPGRTN